MNITKEDHIGKIVADDYRTASIFKAHGIDFCCGGNRSLDEACKKDNIDVEELVEELNLNRDNDKDQSTDYQSWDMDLLADYIEKKHHRYVEKKIPELKTYLAKLVKVHGERHPELVEIHRLFNESGEELVSHMKKEEMILFPYVRQMAIGNNLQNPPFGTVKNPINMMTHEHDNEGNRFKKIAALSDNYTPPADACTTYQVAFQLLREFEEDLHKHIHLENNILFPRALEAENHLTNA